MQPGDIVKVQCRMSPRARVTRTTGCDLKPGFVECAWLVDAPVRPSGLPRDFRKFIVRRSRLQVQA